MIFNYDFFTIKNNPKSSKEKEEVYNLYTKTGSNDTFINIPWLNIVSMDAWYNQSAKIDFEYFWTGATYNTLRYINVDKAF